jgi:hypothetical protein
MCSCPKQPKGHINTVFKYLTNPEKPSRLNGSLKKASSASGLTQDERIQHKLDRKTGGRRRGGSKRNELSFSLPPQSSASSDPDREAIRQSLMEKRKICL